MSKPLVLITGATGHIGFRTLAQLLEAGYRARVTSRSLASADRLKALPSIKPYLDSVETVEVPDVLKEGAFDEVVKGVDYVLHLASPLPDASLSNFDLDSTYIGPAIQGTVGMLKSASKATSVKRVVITASIGVLAPQEGKPTVGPNDIGAVPSRELMQSNAWVAYKGSKILAHEAAVKYTTDNSPHFEVLHILPGYVQGRNETAIKAKTLFDFPSSNATMVQYVMGVKGEMPFPCNLVHVEDVAAVHVAALAIKNVQNGERFTVSGPQIAYKDIDEIVKRLFPEEVKSGLLPLGGEVQGAGMNLDISSTREKFGIEVQGLEAMVQSLIGQYVELLKKEKGAQ